MAEKATVFVVDDGPAIRESLRWLLESAGLQVETYASAEEFLEAFDDSKPGCLLLDVCMPAMNGLELQQRLTARGALTPIVFLTAFGKVPQAVRACQAGAVDFIEKPFRDEVLLMAIRKALAIDRGIREKQVEQATFSERAARLTPREREVMAEVIAGKSTREIASDFGVSHRTVEVHRGRLMHKLEAGSVADVVRIGLHCTETLARQGGGSDLPPSQPGPAKKRVSRGRRKG